MKHHSIARFVALSTLLLVAGTASAQSRLEVDVIDRYGTTTVEVVSFGLEPDGKLGPNTAVLEVRDAAVLRELLVEGDTFDLELRVVGTKGDYLRYKLDRCWIKSWSTSGDADATASESYSLNFKTIKVSTNDYD